MARSGYKEWFFHFIIQLGPLRELTRSQTLAYFALGQDFYFQIFPYLPKSLIMKFTTLAPSLMLLAFAAGKGTLSTSILRPEFLILPG